MVIHSYKLIKEINFSEFDKTQLLCADVLTRSMYLLHCSYFSHDWTGLSIWFLSINCSRILYVNNFHKFDQWINVKRYDSWLHIVSFILRYPPKTFYCFLK